MASSAARMALEAGCALEEQGAFELAFEAYLKAARQGNAEAQVNLANLYDDGKGCSKDPQKAVDWYKRAYKSGSCEGAYNLGIHYKQQGNRRWARYWFERAADMGDADARAELENTP